MSAAASQAFLQTWGLGRRFGGLTAVGSVDLTLNAGEIRAIIGPNGAGKTTLVSMICGRVAPSAGSILFDGADITRLKPWERVTRGIVYTFQITSVFRNLSCFDNVALAAERSLTLQHGLRSAFDTRGLVAPVTAALQRVGLQDRRDELAGNLSYGHQRLLEVAMGLALRPKLLILDEPTQGLSEAEIVSFCRLIRDLAGETTILLIEHNMDVVMELAQRITVMAEGNILAEGSPAEIMANADVQRAYLGT
jgi:branched-chain amino acid transport system ATP-binding protein